MSEVPRTHSEFVEWLVSRHPDLAPTLAEHLADNDGEVLPHLLFGDVTRHAAQLARRAVTEPRADAELTRLLGDLDAALLPAGQEDDDPVDNLVGVSFVENAATDGDEPLRSRLRSYPNLARALGHYELPSTGPTPGTRVASFFRRIGERALSASRGDEHAVPFELGVRWSGGAPLPYLLSSGRRSFVAFYLDEACDGWDGTTVRAVDPADDAVESLGLVEFVGCVAVKLGPPDDEVLVGHHLHGRGLAGNGAYVVESSGWIEELVAINRVHPQFDAGRWADLRHFLLVFHDETVEAVARGIEVQSKQMSMRTLLGETVEKLWLT